MVGFEDVFDFLVERRGDAECEGEAGVVFADFDGVDCLARHAECRGQGRLGEVVFSSEDPESVLHRYWRVALSTPAM